ncbi:hypothetical protein, partial [Microbacterium sp. bgisy189]|uniref:hypothetical protein n=1 Tax=Microbacterium sp. bgisy189 TaxID=3413798 RepID=UPI003EB8C00F
MNRCRRAAVLGAITVAMLFAGCTATTAPAPANTGNATANSTTAPTPTPEVVSEPTIPFAGDCAQLLTDGQLDDLLGAGWVPFEDQLLVWNPDRIPVAEPDATGTLGGLTCAWWSEGEDELEKLEVIVLPAASVPADFVADFSETRCDPSYDVTLCRLAAEVGDVWVMVTAGRDFTEPPAQKLQATIDAVAATAVDSFDGVSADVTEGWWPVPDCAVLFEAISLQEIIGDYVNGYWEGNVQPEETLLRDTGVQALCPASTNGDAPDGGHYIIMPSVYPGAAWHWDELAATEGMAPADIGGASAGLSLAGVGFNALYATDGVNVVMMTLDKDEPVEVAHEILER